MKTQFTSPVDASNYAADLGTAHGIELLSINYETGNYRFKLTDAEGNVISGDRVFGVIATDIENTAEIAADAHIRAAIAATIPA